MSDQDSSREELLASLSAFRDDFGGRAFDDLVLELLPGMRGLLMAQASTSATLGYMHELRGLIDSAMTSCLIIREGFLDGHLRSPDGAVERLRRELDDLSNTLDAMTERRDAASGVHNRQPEHVRQIWLSAAEICSRRFRSRLRFDFKGDDALVADPGVLSIALMQLLVNSCDSLSGSRNGLVTLSSVPCIGTDTVELRISDTGEAHALPSPIDVIFAMGFTTKPGHTGFGLTVARSAARSLGGDLRAEIANDGLVMVLTARRI